jgi:uncharacterized protein YecT (DUF1311 family)
MRKWDQELNGVFGHLKSGLPSGARAALVTSQLAWLRFRDADNRAAEGYEVHPWVLEYQMQLIRTRTLQLQRYDSALNPAPH